MKKGKYTKEIVAHSDYILNCAKNIMHDYHKAEDVSQITLERALRFQHKFDGTHIKAWLYRILFNQCINAFNKLNNEQARLAQFHSEFIRRASTENQHDLHKLIALKEEIIKAIDALPESFRDTAFMIFVEGRAYSEVAEALQCNIGTVMSRLHRARKLLQKELSEIGKEYGLEGDLDDDDD